VALCALSIAITRPAWISNSLTLARYLLPVLPLLLLALACGAARVARTVGVMLGSLRFGSCIAFATAAAPVVALAATTPLRPVLSHPNANSMHILYEFDFRPAHNVLIPHMDRIPLSPWWATLATEPRESRTIAVSPFPVASSAWDAPRWQRDSGQRVLSGFLTGVCATPRPNDVPDDVLFRFRNSVHLSDPEAMAARDVDHVVWQKPYRFVEPGLDVIVGDDVAECGPALRQRMGPPEYEDEWLAVYAIRQTTDAERLKR
jgi:hypothetical protein